MNDNNLAIESKKKLFCLVLASDWSQVNTLQFFFDLKAKNHWDFQYIIVRNNAEFKNNVHIYDQWNNGHVVVVIAMMNFQILELPLKEIFLYNPSMFEIEYKGTKTSLGTDSRTAVKTVSEKFKTNPQKPIALFCYTEDLDAETVGGFMEPAANYCNKVIQLRCQRNGQNAAKGALEHDNWVKIQLVIPFVTPNCFKNEQFVSVLQRALKDNIPIVMVHSFDTPFPPRYSAPESVQAVFDNVAVKFMLHHSRPCWEKIIQRAKRGHEDLSTDVFLSHKQSTGQGVALALYRKLTKLNKKVFLDIKAQFNLHDLKKVVKHTKLFVFIATEGIFDSFWCWEEFQAAVAYGRPIVVVRPSDFQLPTIVKEHFQPYLQQVLDNRHKVVDYDAAYLKHCAERILDNTTHMVLTESRNPSYSQKAVLIDPKIGSTPKPLRFMACGEGARVETFDGANWKSVADLPKPRNFCAMVSLAKKVYVLGGEAQGPLASCLVLNNGSWSEISPMNIPRSCFGAATMGGKIYALGGVTTQGSTNTIEEYDPATNRWTMLQKVHLDTPNYWFGTAASDDAIFIVGGYHNGRKGTVVKFTPAAQKVEVLKVTITPRNSFSAVYHNDMLYAVGGWADGYLPIAVVDLQTLQVLSIPMQTDRFHVGAVVVDGKLIVAGGSKGDQKITGVESLDLTTCQWKTLPAMLQSHTALVVLD